MIHDRVRVALRGESAYNVPTAAPEVRVKLDANESPFALSPAARETLARALADAELHRYPDPAARELKAALAAYFEVNADELSLGNGSDESLALLCSTFAEPAGSRVVIPWPSFVVYRTAAQAAGLEPILVPLGADFSADPSALVAAVGAHRPSLVFLATPNNPTGTVWPRAVIEELARAFPDTLTVVDEAYLAYSAEPSCVDLARAHQNVVVVRTLSKIGLAGLRIGALIGHPEVIGAVEKIRPPYNVGLLAQRAATAILTHHSDELRGHAATIISERERLRVGLASRGLHVFPSQANLLLVRCKDGILTWRQLGAQGIAVRCFGDNGPLAHCLRITVGTPTENDALLAAI
jgi:histidinol-phosphate aminotransferase